jgi:hypothetical protein
MALPHKRLIVGYGERRLAGVVGPSHLGHALMLTHVARVIKVGALSSRRVMLHADQRYYDPIGLPLPSKSFHHRLTPLVFARRGGTDGSLLFRTRLSARAASRTPERPDELTPNQGSPDMALAVK